MSTIILDYDGTLHNSIKIYAPAFRLAYDFLVQEGYAGRKAFCDEEIAVWLGYNSVDMWNAFFPTLPADVKQTCSRMIGERMVELTLQGHAQWYPGSEETLWELKRRGHVLVFLSNCKRSYMETHMHIFSMERFFSGFYCTEDFGFAPKYDIFREIRKHFQGPYIVVGDRFQDMEIAEKYGLYSIGCAYGFGVEQELQNASVVIQSVKEMCELEILA